MTLSSLQLDAFTAVARALSFSKAAQSLSLTQSALSQRVLNLEEELGSTLFYREPTGARLTQTGQRLLQYCETRIGLEQELLGELKNSETPNALQGQIRVVGFSTLVRSQLLPALSEFSLKHPKVQFEVLTRELREIPSLVKTGRVDFAFCTEFSLPGEFESTVVGSEHNVLIEPTRKTPRAQEVILDHDEWDETSSRFFRLQNSKTKHMRREFLDEIYSVIEGVEQGLGSAVVPMHLIQGNTRVRVVRGLRSLKVPVLFVHPKLSYPTRLQNALREHFLTHDWNGLSKANSR